MANPKLVPREVNFTIPGAPGVTVMGVEDGSGNLDFTATVQPGGKAADLAGLFFDFDQAKLGWDDQHELWKANPLADWTDERCWDYIDERGLPVNPLHRQGYSSIGCTHCTAPGAGREGRDRCDQLAGLAEVFAVEPARDLVGDAECVAG